MCMLVPCPTPASDMRAQYCPPPPTPMRVATCLPASMHEGCCAWQVTQQGPRCGVKGYSTEYIVPPDCHNFAEQAGVDLHVSLQRCISLAGPPSPATASVLITRFLHALWQPAHAMQHGNDARSVRSLLRQVWQLMRALGAERMCGLSLADLVSPDYVPSPHLLGPWDSVCLPADCEPCRNATVMAQV